MAKNTKRLIQAARRARRHSHAPYSGFRVGAALLTSTGRIVTGCNVENSSYGLTMCAERTAIFKAVSEGIHRFSAIAITADRNSPIPPCGACRQVLWDLAGNITIILDSRRGSPLQLKLENLLPIPFDSRKLRSKKRSRS